MNNFRKKLADYLYRLSVKCRKYPKSSPSRQPKPEVRIYNRIPEEFECYINRKWFPYVIFLLNEPHRYESRYLYENRSADLFFRNWFHVLYTFMEELDDLDDNAEWLRENRNESILVLMRQIESIDTARLAFKAWIDTDDPKSAYKELHDDLYAYEHPHPVPPSMFKYEDLPF